MLCDISDEQLHTHELSYTYNGLNCDYVDDWKDMYSAISLYVYYL